MVDLLASLYDRYISMYCRGRLVDLGCGKVPLYEAYKSYVDDIICVDWPDSFHRTCFVDYECDLNCPLPFCDEEFDTAILSDVLEHLSEPRRVWRELQRILRHGGKCLISVPFYYWLHEEPFDYYRYTEHALRRFAAETGFRVLVLEAIGGAPEIVADIVSKCLDRFPVLNHAPRITRFLAKSVQASAFAFLSTRLGKRISRETAKQFPFGYFMIVEKCAE